MRTNRFNFALASGLLAIAALACSATTANISSLKIGKDKDVSQENSTFGANDTTYALATISNAPGKVKVKGRLVFEDVPGQQAGPVPGLEKTLDLAGSGTATYSFTPPPEGWPKGKYKVEVILMTEEGEQKDQKSSSFTVS
jgi:hypothetical protein